MSAYDYYEFYLEVKDLKDQAHVVKIERVRVAEFFNRGKNEKKIVLRFVNRRKSMILNKTQAAAVMDITGTDDEKKWVGAEIVLTGGRASNGKETIVITTKAESGDLDLMYPPTPLSRSAATSSQMGGEGKVNIPKAWWDARSEDAVMFAAQKWRVTNAEAWAKIDQAIKAEALSEFLPISEFKEYVEAPAC